MADHLESVPFVSALREAARSGGPHRRLVVGWLLLTGLSGWWPLLESNGHSLAYFSLQLSVFGPTLNLDVFMPYALWISVGLLFGLGWGASMAYFGTAVTYVGQGYRLVEALLAAWADPLDLLVLIYALRFFGLQLRWRPRRQLASFVFLALFSSLIGSLQATACSFLFDSRAVQRGTIMVFWESWFAGAFVQKIAVILPLAIVLAPRLARFKAACRARLPAVEPETAARATVVGTAALLLFAALFVFDVTQIVRHVFRPLLATASTELAVSLSKAISFFVVMSGIAALGVLWVLGEHYLRGAAELRQNLEELRREREQFWRTLALSEKMGAIGTLAGGVAHEFNNILQGIMASVDFALRTDRPQAVRSALEVAQQNCERAGRLTRSLLSFSRRSEGARQAVDLGEMVRECSTLMERPLQKSHIDLIVEAPDLLPPVQADRGALAQTLLSLIANARAAVEANRQPGHIRIRLSGHNGEVVLEVEDSGCGIPEAELSRIFEPFYTTRPAGSGTGLSLATAYGVVRDHGGRIEVRSQVGVGSTFRVVLPAK